MISVLACEITVVVVKHEKNGGNEGKMCVLLSAKLLFPLISRVSGFSPDVLKYLFLVNVFTKSVDFSRVFKHENIILLLYVHIHIIGEGAVLIAVLQS